MSNYTINVDWDGKDALADSSAAKVISGDDFQTEFETVQTAVNSKADIASPTLTGIPAAPTAAADTNTTQIATTAFVTTAANALNAAAYPVGAIFTTTYAYANSAEVVAAIGGTTWAAFGSGKVLVGVDTGDSDFNTIEETGGSKTVSSGTTGSTAADLAAHTHTIQRVDPTTGDSTAGVGSYTSSDADAGTFTTGETGSGGGHTHTTPAHSLVQPYITVYFWKRTA